MMVFDNPYVSTVNLRTSICSLPANRVSLSFICNTLNRGDRNELCFQTTPALSTLGSRALKVANLALGYSARVSSVCFGSTKYLTEKVPTLSRARHYLGAEEAKPMKERDPSPASQDGLEGGWLFCSAWGRLRTQTAEPTLV
jgi:hypothetical protein